MIKFKRYFTLLFLLSALVLTGCNSGGGGSGSSSATPTATVTGTAASGAPIAGTVSVKDSLGAVRTVTIASDGKYTLDVSGMTAPFMLHAEGNVGGRTYNLFSAAVAADINGTVNVTPLTDLIVANVAGQIASTLYSSGNFSGLTPTELTQAETNLQTRLQPVLTALGLDASTDLLRATFNANHTGQDALLDVLRVTVDLNTAQATILNIINNQQIVDDLTTQTDMTMVNASGMTTGLTDMQAIVAQFDAWSALFANSLPAANAPALLALFDPTFLSFGDNLTNFLADLTSNPLFIGTKFTNVSLESISTNTAKARFLVQSGGGRSDAVTFVVNKVNGVWLLAGDQRIVDLSVYAYAANRTAGTYAPGITTGLWVVFHPGAVSPAIHYAVVTGTGLPTMGGGRDGASAGALLVDYLNGNFNFAQGPYNGTNTARLTDINGFTIYSNQLPLSNTSIDLIADNTTYTINVYSDNNTPSNLADDTLLATYTEVVGKRPYKSNELSVASFPAVSTTAAQVGTFANAGGSLTANWTLPAGLKSDEFDIFRFDGGPNLDINNADLAATATSATLSWLAPTFNVMGYGVQVRARDTFNRSLETIVGHN
jgi:hypothetical protein